MKVVILDTGPLLAWLCPRDQYHGWAQTAFANMAPGSLVCEAVITEVCHLAAKEHIARADVLRFVKRLRLKPVALSDEFEAVEKLLASYSDAPMDFADACVVRLAEMNRGLKVCTVDGQFRFFRKNGTESISLIAPFTS